MKFKAQINPDNPEEYVITITEFPEGTKFYTVGLSVFPNVEHVVVSTNVPVKKASFSYGDPQL
jgi:hypothetical protein